MKTEFYKKQSRHLTPKHPMFPRTASQTPEMSDQIGLVCQTISLNPALQRQIKQEYTFGYITTIYFNQTAHNCQGAIHAFTEIIPIEMNERAVKIARKYGEIFFQKTVDKQSPPAV